MAIQYFQGLQATPAVETVTQQQNNNVQYSSQVEVSSENRRPSTQAHIVENQLHSIYNSNYVRVEHLTRTLLISHQQLEVICNLLEGEFKRGLHRETNSDANVKMYPTHIRDQNCTTLGHFAEPEEGKVLALDLGGTNFRVILVEVEGAQFHVDNETYSLSQELMHGPGIQLFDYIADCLHKFVVKRGLSDHRLPLGFTFSFPCQQDDLAHARLVNWTKGFKCSGVEGRDVVELLREAIGRRSDLEIEVMAVVNDTTGTLISCAHQNRECRVGLIVGTGTNACYMERVDNVHCMNQEVNEVNNEEQASPYDDIWHPRRQQQTTVVNTEWGAFGDNGILDFVRTNWDHEIDVNSVNIGKQKFEKMISGLYIGELCRRIMIDMALEEGVLFQTTIDHLDSSVNSSLCFADSEKVRNRNKLLIDGKFSKTFSFETRYVSMVESDPVDVFENTRRALNEAFGIDWASDQDCASVKLICSRVSTRAAYLVSAAVACLLNKMARPHTVVGVDGSMFKFHPHFHTIMAKKTKELTQPEYNFQLMFSEDGSGRGAAIVAAVACKRRRISKEILQERQRKASAVKMG